MSEGLLEVQNLSKTFAARRGLWGPQHRIAAVNDVSFSLEKGRTLGLVGESGSGKSTIGRLLVRLIEADGGEIRFRGVDLRALPPLALRRMRRHLQIVSQEPQSSFDPRVRVGSAIMAAIRLHRLRPEAGVRDRMAELLGDVGLPPDLGDRFPHQLSGGQLKRLAIARALSVEPELIVLDEVLSALDVLAQAEILNLLAELQRRLAMSFVFISHDLGAVFQIASDVGVLQSGRLIELGSKDDVRDRPQHAYTKRLLSAARRLQAPPAIQRGLWRSLSGAQPDTAGQAD